MFRKDSLEIFINNLKKTNRDWGYYTDYIKAQNRIEVFSELVNHIGIVNEAEFRERFLAFTSEHPETIKATPLFSAVSDMEVTVIEEGVERTLDFKSITNRECIEFLEKVDFFQIFENGRVNLPSYFLGVAVGLDSNGRKNRGGKLMENFVRNKLLESRWMEGTQWMSQVKSTQISEKFGINFAKLAISKKIKQFDFVIVSDEHIYLVETNFFNSGGSKINAMLGRFKEITQNLRANYASTTHQIHFLVITDGQKIKTDMGGLEDAYEELELIMNIHNLENNSLDELN